MEILGIIGFAIIVMLFIACYKLYVGGQEIKNKNIKNAGLLLMSCMALGVIAFFLADSLIRLVG